MIHNTKRRKSFRKGGGGTLWFRLLYTLKNITIRHLCNILFGRTGYYKQTRGGGGICYRGIHEKGSGDVVSAVCVQKER